MPVNQAVLPLYHWFGDVSAVAHRVIACKAIALQMQAHA